MRTQVLTGAIILLVFEVPRWRMHICYDLSAFTSLSSLFTSQRRVLSHSKRSLPLNKLFDRIEIKVSLCKSAFPVYQGRSPRHVQQGYVIRVLRTCVCCVCFVYETGRTTTSVRLMDNIRVGYVQIVSFDRVLGHETSRQPCEPRVGSSALFFSIFCWNPIVIRENRVILAW